MNEPKRTEGQEMAVSMARFVNNLCYDSYSFIEEMLIQHPTLQQSFTQLCLQWMYKLSESTREDLRNEESIKAAKKIKECLGEYGNHLPLI